VHRSTSSVLAGVLALPLTVLGATAAEAERPKPRTVGVTLKTDAMPTRVQVTTRSGRVTCVKITTGAGRERRVRLAFDGDREARLDIRLGARETSRCLFAGTAAPRGSTLDIRVEENILGPFDLTATADLTV
jgi:hypothetical protein